MDRSVDNNEDIMKWIEVQGDREIVGLECPPMFYVPGPYFWSTNPFLHFSYDFLFLY